MTLIRLRWICFIPLLLIFIVGCATPYTDSKGSITGGYSVKHMEGDIYRVAFYGNGYTTKETVQTYWLYKCTEVALDNGFQGFEILSHITLTENIPADEYFAPAKLARKAQVYYIPMNTMSHPELSADIRLLKEPFEVTLPKIFDANALQEALSPYVNAEEKCSSGNVCEHVHKYLFEKQMPAVKGIEKGIEKGDEEI